MGSLEGGPTFKRDPLLRSSSSSGRTERHPFLQRQRSRFSRFFLFKKLDYVQWICTVGVFLFFVVLFQMYLPGSVIEKSIKTLQDEELSSGDLMYLNEYGMLDFGEDIRFEPSKILDKFKKENREVNLSNAFNRTLLRYPHRKPQLALVFADLLVDSQQLLMVTVAAALQELGYEIQVYSLEGGPVHDIWRNLGVPVNIVQACDRADVTIDWLTFVQEPFKSLPLVWTIHDRALATRSRKYTSNKHIELLNDWKKAFNRSTVVVFTNYVLPMIYSTFDAGNFFVIPGSPAEEWKTDSLLASENDFLRSKMGFSPEDIVITIVGSEFLYRGLWLEHSIVLQALLPFIEDFSSNSNLFSNLKIIVLSAHSTSNYSSAIEAIALNLKYPSGIVKHLPIDNADEVLTTSNVVIYGSFLEEQNFPDILIKAMSLGKPIIASDISIIRKYVDDRVNGYLFPKGNVKALSQVILQVIWKGKLSPLAHNMAEIGRSTAKNLMVAECVEGYTLLLDNILKLPSEVALPKAVSEIPLNLKEKWQWHLFESVSDLKNLNTTLRSYAFLDKFEEQWSLSQLEKSGPTTEADDSFIYSIWQEEKDSEMANTRKRREEEELKDRGDQSHGTWEEVYRNAKRADRTKNDLHERDDGELERTGQPLCIYEPFFGEGAWPFLHRTSLYRGIGLSTKGRRRGADDIDAPSRLSLLNSAYYRDVLGEYGAFFAIANRIDRVHKNAWIGFVSWRATARMASLSGVAENALLHAIQTRRHGDALYFWVRMDMDLRNPLKLDFWSFCDAINAGNCKFAFSEAFKKMYGLKHDLESLPPMPQDGDTWSVMHSWALPTKSFLEFVMFSRMFVDALDSQMYDQHHSNGHCYLSLSKDKHCYSRLLELLVNVWVYHSARRMVYVNPETGAMNEQHKFKSRRSHMWIKWFSYSTLKSMDEDFAEEADSDRPAKRWLWPSTGEVFWQGVFERERNLRHQKKEQRKQKSREKLDRMRRRNRQKVIGKFVKPPPDDVESLNTTMSIGNS
ncbi:Glycosyl transferase [Parasponia andersonii]|uniref:Glycosyl transferase n=1 Tax=Parasponia andersonii TaxID=3476 RepID=A0A2P5BLE2_PARAD|nr:Glycosyl transferase [Parasponia andersonii]